VYGIAIFGCGYVGLVSAACFAHLGHAVICYDTDFTKIHELQNGSIPFFEPGLAELVAEQTARGRLHFVATPQEALEDCRVAFIAVGTPTGPTGEADLTYVRQAARDIAMFATGPIIVINKSTVPVETADLVERIIRANGNPAYHFSVASNPEFLREGSAVGDFLHPDRVVIGSSDAEAIAVLREIYAPLGAPIHVVDVHTAEMIKYTANAFLATKISFINEIANLCASVDADIDDVIAGIGADARIGRSYLEPGLGFGGSCLPKDVAALAHVARRHSIEPTMLDATLSVNRRQVAEGIRMIEEALGDLDDCELAVAGLAFKGGTDDVRESPSLLLVEALLTRGASVRVHDAYAMRRARTRLQDRVQYFDSPYKLCDGATALIVANDERSYAKLDWRRIAASLNGNHVIDLRNRLDREHIRKAGMQYIAFGRTRRRMPVS
jgi:UDPglucose 6-dehydrogenase